MAKKKVRRAPKRATRPAKKAGKKRVAPKRKAPARRLEDKKHVPTQGLYGWITHTELQSASPEATRTWCALVLGWKFRDPYPTPDGPYHLYAYSEKGGGGIRKVQANEPAGTTPYVHVEDAQAAFDKAVKAGAEVMIPPMRVMEGVTIALVRAPGGVPIGFSGP